MLITHVHDCEYRIGMSTLLIANTGDHEHVLLVYEQCSFRVGCW